MSIYILWSIILLSSGIWSTVDCSCIGSGCVCYKRMSMVYCDYGRVTLIPDMVKMISENLDFEHVLQGSLNYLDIATNWPSLKRINFKMFSPYVCKWLENAQIPDNIEILSKCSRRFTRRANRDTTQTTSKQQDMTAKLNIRGMVTDAYVENHTQDVNETTQESYSVSVELDAGEIVATVVVPITFVIAATLILCIRWNLNNPTSINVDCRMTTNGVKEPKSPPPETSSGLMDTSVASSSSTPGKNYMSPFRDRDNFYMKNHFLYMNVCTF